MKRFTRFTAFSAKGASAKKIVLLLSFLTGSVSLVFGWGIWGHQHINRGAIFALPAEMRGFFYNHADYITEESGMPDVRKHLYKDKTESSRHFINLEAYSSTVDSLPVNFAEATEKWGAPYLEKNGILPWCISAFKDSLTKAFRNRRSATILFLAADLGHYIGDAHMPLHVSINHDGVSTGQRGIHGFWEGQLPEMFGNGYNLHTGPARYIADVDAEIRHILIATHALADSMLMIDRATMQGLPKDQIYKMDEKGNPAVSYYGDPEHTEEYAKRYHAALHGMVERQLQLAIESTASFWYTAWVDAGKPALDSLDPAAMTRRYRPFLRRDLRRWEEGKIDMEKPDREY